MAQLLFQNRQRVTTMVRDIACTLCVIVTLVVAASLAVEVRYQFAAIEIALRQASPAAGWPQPPQGEPKPPGRLRQFGRSVLDMADAGLGVIR